METVTMETLHKDIKKLCGEVKLIRNIISEEYELSDWTKKELKEARAVPDSGLISHEEAKKRILRR